MTARELREFTIEELIEKERDLRDSLFKIRFRVVVRDEGEANKIRSLKKDIARIKTVIREKVLYGGR